MKIYKITKNIDVLCETKSTRNGFKHEATLFVGGNEYDKTKCLYQNRTWEAFLYQSVLQKLWDRANSGDHCYKLTPYELRTFRSIT